MSSRSAASCRSIRSVITNGSCLRLLISVLVRKIGRDRQNRWS
jgi:hypothetical protein